MTRHLSSVITLGVFVGLFLAANSWAQQSGTPAAGTLSPFVPGRETTQTLKPPLVLEYRTREGLDSFFDDSGTIVPAERTRIQQLVVELREATDDAKKAGLTKQLEAAVTATFEEDLTSREAELTKLEERLAKLRALLDRRRKAQGEIIQLQLKVMINEADGLGFSGASATNGLSTTPADSSFFVPAGSVPAGSPPRRVGQ